MTKYVVQRILGGDQEHDPRGKATVAAGSVFQICQAFGKEDVYNVSFKILFPRNLISIIFVANRRAILRPNLAQVTGNLGIFFFKPALSQYNCPIKKLCGFKGSLETFENF